MTARRADIPKAFLSQISGILSQPVVSKNEDQFFVIDTLHKTPGNRIDFHKKISQYHTNIRVGHIPQM